MSIRFYSFFEILFYAATLTKHGEYALFLKKKAAKKTCWRCLDARRSVPFPPVNWKAVAKSWNAPEIRDISHTARMHASMILADVFYRYTAARYWRRQAAAISNATCSFGQHERASNVLSSLPANPNTSFKGRAAQQTEHRPANQHRREVFFAQLFR